MEDMYRYLLSYLDQESIDNLKEEMEKPNPYKGLFLNRRRCPEKVVIEEFKTLRQDSVDKDLYRYDPSIDFPGRNPLYDAGAYYILDPSSSKTSLSLGAGRKEVVLDMCSAPGGKTIAFALRNPGSLIVANDISASRAEELSKNVERMGLDNVIVTSLAPQRFIDYGLADFFSSIILDAPCSGTGMFRKEEKMKDDWSYEKAMKLLPIQDELLEKAYELVKPNGTILYSTCSYLKEEDEDRLAFFTDKHKDISIRPIRKEEGFYFGTVPGTVHLFPSLFKGEGHFFSLLTKSGEDSGTYETYKKAEFSPELNLFIIKTDKGRYGISRPIRQLISLPFLRCGIKLTDTSKYAKIKEDHALSHYLIDRPSLELDIEEAERYLRGEEFKKDGINLPDGSILISYKGVNLGFGLKKGARIRNMYPKGLRYFSL